MRMTHRWVHKPGQEIPFRSYHDFVNPNTTGDGAVDPAKLMSMLTFARKQEPLTALVIYIPEMANNKYELTVHFQDAAQ